MISEITPADLSARLRMDHGDLFVLDVQPAADYEDWHVPGSENIDVYDQLQHDPESAREELSTIPETEVVLTCTAGATSEKVAEHLHEMGYDVKTLVCHRP